METPGNEVQVTTSQSDTKKGWFETVTPLVLGLATVLGGLYVIAFGQPDRAAIAATLVTIVITYYFGTGAGSQAKDKVIAALKSAVGPAQG